MKRLSGAGWILSLIICIIPWTGKAQDFIRQITQLEKEIFFASNAEERALLVIEQVEIYKITGDYEDALNSLDQQLQFTIRHDEHWLRLRYEQGLLLYLLERYNKAWDVLSDLSEEQWPGIGYLKALIYLELEDEGLEFFLLDYKTGDTIFANPTAAVSRSDIKSSSKAKLFSLFFPGLGQLYTNHPKGAFTTFLLQGGMAGFIVLNVLTGNLLAACLVGGALFIYFKAGDITKAGEMAVSYNSRMVEAKKAELRQKILFQVQKFLN